MDAHISEPQKIARRLPRRMLQLENAAKEFQIDRKYSETEVNVKLMALFDDHVFARRLLIEWGFLDRTSDGSSYWLNPGRGSRTETLEL